MEQGGYWGQLLRHAMRDGLLKRLARKRGVIYLIDFCLGRILKKYYQDPNVLLFPDINSNLIENIRANNIYYDSETPHNQNTLDIVRKYNPDYILLLGAPVIKPSLFQRESRC